MHQNYFHVYLYVMSALVPLQQPALQMKIKQQSSSFGGQDFPGVHWSHAPFLRDVNPIYALLEMFPRCNLLVGRSILVLGASLGERGVGCRNGGRVGEGGREKYG